MYEIVAGELKIFVQQSIVQAEGSQFLLILSLHTCFRLIPRIQLTSIS